MSELRFCGHCGAEVALGESHCMECGTRIQIPPIVSPPQAIPSTARIPQATNQAQQPTIPSYIPSQIQKPIMPPAQINCPNCHLSSPFQVKFCPNCGAEMKPRSPGFIEYLQGLILADKEILSKQINTASVLNTFGLLLIFLLLQFITMQYLLQNLFPFELQGSILEELKESSGADTNFIQSSAATIFSFYAVILFFIVFLFGWIGITVILRLNSANHPSPKSVKKGFIIASSTLLPLLGLTILRLILEIIFSGGTDPQISIISTQDQLLDFLLMALNRDPSRNWSVSIPILIIQAIWSGFLFYRLLQATGYFPKSNSLYYWTTLYVVLGGGIFDFIISL
ncbi:MAG: double zinc ribbon domain-containing protein [Candidatus Hodarchaeales archaeon]|jgi:hypothetical protein